MGRTTTTPEQKVAGRRLLEIIAVVLLLTATASASAISAQEISFDIERQAMGPALRSFADQADRQIYYAENLVRGLECTGLAGRYEPDAALSFLLADSGLDFNLADNETYVIVKVESETEDSPAGSDPPAQPDDPASNDGQNSVVAGQTAADEAPPEQPQEAGAEDPTPTEISEAEERRKFTGQITVSAERREQNVREIPASISVAEGKDLEADAAASMDDFFNKTPGVNYVEGVPQRGTITMRGIATTLNPNLAQAPVGVYINEIPTTDYFAFSSNFDLSPFDVERVEFLKGPQGSLYGAASLGGTARYIVRTPNLDRNEAAVHLTAGSTAGAPSANILGQGMFNVVLADGKFALRGVVSYLDDAGWITDVSGGEIDEGTNRYDQTSIRLMAGWEPSENFRIDLSYLTQETNVNAGYVIDDPDFDNPTVGHGDWTFGGPSSYDQSIANLTLHWGLGFAELMSSTSYLEKNNQANTLFGGMPAFDWVTLQEIILGFGMGLPVNPGDLSSQVTEAYFGLDPMDSESWFQEIRLVSNTTGSFDWIAGVYYAHAKDQFGNWLDLIGIEDALNEIVPPMGSVFYPGDRWFLFDWTDDATELALYGELGIGLSEKWKLNLGGRYTDFENEKIYSETIYGGTRGDDNTFSMKVFAPKISLAHRPNDNLMWYALASRGYRAGGVNAAYILSTPDPAEEFMFYDTDNLWNYEAGVRKTWAGGRVTTDATLFYLDWTDIQLEATVLDPALGFINAVFNTGAAHSLGVEAVVVAQLTRGFSFTTSINWTEAELDQATPVLINPETNEPVILPPGTKLPVTPEWTAATTLQYYFDNRSLGYPFIALDNFYSDGYVVLLESGRSVPSHSLFGLRLGATVLDGLQLTLAVRNLLDERIPIRNDFPRDGSVFPNVWPETWGITRPRTISLTAQMNFDF